VLTTERKSGADRQNRGGPTFDTLVLSLPLIGTVTVTLFLSVLGEKPLLVGLFSPYQSFPLVTISAILATLATLRRFEIAPVLLLGTSLEAMRIVLLLSQGRNVLESWSTFGQGFWYASVLVALLHVIRSGYAERWQEVDRALLRISLPLGVGIALFGLHVTVRNIPTTFDTVLYAFDGLLGPPIATILASLCGNNSVLWVAVSIAYESIWLVLSAFLFAQCQTDQRMAVGLMSRWILLTVVGWLLYFILPGTNPGAVFWNVYGNQLPSPNDVSLERLAVQGEQPRNAMPSLHMSWAVLLAMEGGRMGKAWARIGISFVLITAVATLGVREHYLIDLIVAVPFTVFIYAVSFLFRGPARSTQRLAAALGGAAMTALLLFTIRFGTEVLREAPGIARFLVAGVVLLALALHLAAERKARLASFTLAATWKKKPLTTGLDRER
jgi:hypothetical protein